jgi:hypothetical protein
MLHFQKATFFRKVFNLGYPVVHAPVLLLALVASLACTPAVPSTVVLLGDVLLLLLWSLLAVAAVSGPAAVPPGWYSLWLFRRLAALIEAQ